MSKIFCLIFLVFLEAIPISSECIERKNNCEICNPLTGLCAKCIQGNYIPDNDGGCISKCILGKNFCQKCDEDGKLCVSCQDKYFPDEIGGCSFTQNCETSYKGICQKCIENYVLIGENYVQFCKSLNSDDLKNCKSVNITNGFCDECEKGYYLNKGDFKCIDKENCLESLFGICLACVEGYYLNKIQEKCIKNHNPFYNCKLTLDEKTCAQCNDYYYSSEDSQCVNTLKCSKAEKGICTKCVNGYFLTKNNICIDDENCETGDIVTGICSLCKSDYYLDYKDRKCKPNNEDSEYKYCIIYDKKCKKCKEGYYIGEDSKCSSTEKCAESDNGICLACSSNYYLGLDNRCSSVEHCIYSGNSDTYPCDECDKDYYFNTLNNSCLIGEEKFKHCGIAILEGTTCARCHEGFYLNKADNLCYDNSQENEFYKCERTDNLGKFCDICEKNYFLGRGDNKCTTIENCRYSENPNKCIECNDYYCLDKKQQKCYDNDFLEDTDKLFYIACVKTNEEGTACEECLNGYEINEEGICVDIEKCEEKDEDGKCIKCIDDVLESEKNYCANSIYGCVQTFLNHCIKCENLGDLYTCTQCEQGYFLNYYERCFKE